MVRRLPCLQCNSLILTYSFLTACLCVMKHTHTLLCKDNCVEANDEATIVEAVQCSQDAQAGYACDYCSKRQPMAFNEVKECCKGHGALREKLGGETA